MRMLQGLSVGGELPGSVVYQVESAPAHKRGHAPAYYLSATAVVAAGALMMLRDRTGA